MVALLQLGEKGPPPLARLLSAPLGRLLPAPPPLGRLLSLPPPLLARLFSKITPLPPAPELVGVCGLLAFVNCGKGDKWPREPFL